MAFSLVPASWAPRLQPGGAAAASLSSHVLLAVAAPRLGVSVGQARVHAAPRCAAINGPGASVEVPVAGEAKEEDGKKGVLKKRARGRPVWRRILFASKKTQSIIILNALTVIYGTRISLGLIPACHFVRLMWRRRIRHRELESI
jgi:hypothetical protein